MNQVILCGRLTKEPESKATQSGNSMTRYGLAVDRRRKEDGVDYFNIIAFGKAADFAANYFHKGMRVLVSGRIQTNSYVNREGSKVNSFDIIADNQEFADGKQAPVRRTAPDEDWIQVDEDSGGIPF